MKWKAKKKTEKTTEKTTMADVVGSVLFTREQIERRAKEIGQQIAEDYKGQKVILVGILRGAVMWMSDVMKNVDLDMTIDFMAVSSYGSSKKSSGIVKINKDLDTNIEDQNVIIVEDIVDSGITLNYLVGYLQSRGAKSIRICSLLNKQCNRKVDLHADYIGFEVENLFIVGYGLDYDQRYRNLPYISYLEDED